MENFTSYAPTHPGELLKDELEARNMTQKRIGKSVELFLFRH